MERLNEKIEQPIHDRFFARRLLKGLCDLKPLRAIIVLGPIEVPIEEAPEQRYRPIELGQRLLALA